MSTETNKTITETTRKSYKEVYRIIENSTDEIKNKIPSKFIEFLKSIMSEDYEPDIDYDKPLKEQHLLEETIIIMAVIYRDYICSKEERKKLVFEENERLRQIEEEKRKLYNPDNLFKTKEIEKKKDEAETKEIAIIEKKSFIKRILEKITNVFKKKS